MRTRLLVSGALAAGSLLLGACAGDDLSDPASSSEGTAAKGTIRLSGQNWPEAALMAEMYTQLLEADGYTVEAKLVGSRDVYMKGGEFPDNIDIVPEYVGGIIDFLNKQENGVDDEPLATSDAQESLDAAADLIEAAGITLLEPSEATDENAFFVTAENAQANGWTKLSDLEGETMKLAGAPDCEGRSDCEGGLTGVYGIDITELLPLGFGGDAVNQAVLDDEAQLGETATTDGALEALGLVILEDDKGIQPAGNLVPAVSTAFLEEHPDLEDTLGALMDALTTENLGEMNAEIAVDRAKPADVARAFLEDNDLL